MSHGNRGANGSTGSKWIRPEKRLAIYLRDGFRCVYCDRDLHGAPAESVTLDHLDGVHAPGHHGARNLVTACRACNSSRGARRWRAFATPEATARIQRQRRRKLDRYLLQARGLRR